jgi:ElaB/YqjD/DUF883 family membrane-anchored ribosome-binding protein
MSTAKPREDAISHLKNSAHEIQNEFNDAANHAGRKVRGMLSSANDEFTNASDKVTSEIRSNPVRSSAIALAAGVVLGFIFSPSRRSK